MDHRTAKEIVEVQVGHAFHSQESLSEGAPRLWNDPGQVPREIGWSVHMHIGVVDKWRASYSVCTSARTYQARTVFDQMRSGDFHSLHFA